METRKVICESGNSYHGKTSWDEVFGCKHLHGHMNQPTSQSAVLAPHTSSCSISTPLLNAWGGWYPKTAASLQACTTSTSRMAAGVCQRNEWYGPANLFQFHGLHPSPPNNFPIVVLQLRSWLEDDFVAVHQHAVARAEECLDKSRLQSAYRVCLSDPKFLVYFVPDDRFLQRFVWQNQSNAARNQDWRTCALALRLSSRSLGAPATARHQSERLVPQGPALLRSISHPHLAASAGLSPATTRPPTYMSYLEGWTDFLADRR